MTVHVTSLVLSDCKHATGSVKTYSV